MCSGNDFYTKTINTESKNKIAEDWFNVTFPTKEKGYPMIAFYKPKPNLENMYLSARYE